MVKILSIFVAFLENMNFTTTKEKPRAYCPNIYSDIYCGVETASWEYTLARKLFRAKGNDLSIKQTEP